MASVDPSTKMVESVEKLPKQQDQRIREVPHVIDLEKIAEGFLYDAKNYLRDLLKLFQIVYDCNLKDASAFADMKQTGESEIVKWAEFKFGKDDKLTKLLHTETAWTTESIRMRNAVEHPGEKSGTLAILNIRLTEDQAKFIPPTWQRTGCPEAISSLIWILGSITC